MKSKTYIATLIITAALLTIGSAQDPDTSSLFGKPTGATEEPVPEPVAPTPAPKTSVPQMGTLRPVARVAPLTPKAEVKDPIVANWRFTSGETVWRFREDGTTTSDMFPNADPGIWKFEGTASGGTRKYTLVWRNNKDGVITQPLVLDKTGTKMKGKDRGGKLDLERITEVATPATTKDKFGETVSVVPAKPAEVPESKTDPIVANWRIESTVFRFRKDGTAQNDMFPNLPGVWRFNETASGGTRKYTLIWNDGESVAYLILDKSGMKIKGKNIRGEKLDLVRITEVAVPAITKDEFGEPVAPPGAKTDPIIANWRVPGLTVWRFRADGTAKSDMFPNASPGVWKLESDNTGNRKYKVIWNDGGVVGTLVMSTNGSKLRYRDNQDQKFDLEKITEVPVK